MKYKHVRKNVASGSEWVVKFNGFGLMPSDGSLNRKLAEATKLQSLGEVVLGLARA